MRITFDVAIKKLESLYPVWVTIPVARHERQTLRFQSVVAEGEIDITISKGDILSKYSEQWACLEITLNGTFLFRETYSVGTKHHWWYGAIPDIPKEYLKLLEFFRPFQEKREAEESAHREASLKRGLIQEQELTEMQKKFFR